VSETVVVVVPTFLLDELLVDEEVVLLDALRTLEQTLLL
jgi:hypothetical protein